MSKAIRQSQKLLDLPSFQACTEERELSRLTQEEKLLAFVDVFGAVPPSELPLAAFDREMSYLPVDRKRALHRGYTVEQVRRFLLLEDNDPKRAAERMARYWERRYQLLGEDAFSQVNRTVRTEEDFRRIYSTAGKALVDPKVDAETKVWARHYINEWNRMHMLQFNDELDKIRPEDKYELLEAQKKRPEIAISDEQKLRFLSCEDFKPQRAARRMVRYWKLRFDLWGRERALDRITMEELMKDYPNELSMGMMRYAQKTDAAGRCIVFCLPGVLQKKHDEDGLLRVTWYTFHAVMEEASSHNGIRLFNIEKGFSASSVTMRFARKMAEMLFHCCPVKVVAVHECVPPESSWFVKIVAPIFKMLLGRHQRMRYCIHCGSEEKIRTDLANYGIGKEVLPLDLGGDVDYEMLGRSWLEKQREAGF